MSGGCIEWKDELSSYLDNEVDSTARGQIAGHLLTCQPCRQEYAALKAVSTFARAGFDSLPVPSLWEGVNSALPGTCEIIQEDLSAYLDGELCLAAQEGVNEHLRQCPGCRLKFKGLNMTNQCIATGLELPAKVSVDLWPAVKSRLNEDCTLIESELSIFIDQEVATLRHRSITKHLLECPSCQRQFSKLSQVGELVRSHYQPAAPDSFDLWPRIKQAINVIPINAAARSAGHITGRTSRKRLIFTAAAVAFALTGTLAYLVTTSSNKSIEPVSAEAYLLESALMEPGESAEAVVYENQ